MCDKRESENSEERVVFKLDKDAKEDERRGHHEGVKQKKEREREHLVESAF